MKPPSPYAQTTARQLAAILDAHIFPFESDGSLISAATLALHRYALGRLIILDEMRAAANAFAKVAEEKSKYGLLGSANAARTSQNILLEFAQRIEERMPEFPCA